MTLRMTLREFLDQSSGDDDVYRALEFLSNEDSTPGRALSQTVDNIKKERLIREDAWKAFCETVCECPKETEELCGTITYWARAAWQEDGWATKPGFQGPRAATEKGCVFANCNTLEGQCTYLATLTDWANSTDDVKIELRKVIEEQDIERQRARLTGTPLRGHDVMWATFNDKKQTGDPLGNLPSDAEVILASLGIAAWNEDDGVVVFRYCLLDESGLPHIPTILEACSSKTWNPLWRANEGSADEAPLVCGWTCPRPGYEDKGARPSPEVVHTPVLGDSIGEMIEFFPPSTER